MTLTVAAILAYLPLTLIYGPFDWIETGLFSVQKSRPLLYGVYFFAGAAVGAAGLGGGLLAPDAVLVRRWRRLAALSPLMLFLWMGLTGVTLSFPGFAPLTMRVLSGLAYVGASVAGVMLLMALVTRFCSERISWLEPLSRNSLGIFILHYVPLVWMQYALTGAPLPAILKALIVLLVAFAISLAGALALRRSEWTAWLIGEGRLGVAAKQPAAALRRKRNRSHAGDAAGLRRNAFELPQHPQDRLLMRLQPAWGRRARFKFGEPAVEVAGAVRGQHAGMHVTGATHGGGVAERLGGLAHRRRDLPFAPALRFRRRLGGERQRAKQRAAPGAEILGGDATARRAFQIGVDVGGRDAVRLAGLVDVAKQLLAG